MPKLRWFIFILGALLCLFPEALRAAEAARPAPKYSIQKWEAEDGLPTGSIECMTLTRDGYLWLGTLGGLVRFDGMRFKVYDPNTLPGLPEARIKHLFEDSRSNLWIGTENGGTVRMKGGRILSVPGLTMPGSERRLQSACEDAAGVVWLYNANGDIWRVAAEGATPTPHYLPAELSKPMMRVVMQETNGPLWVATTRSQRAIGAAVAGDVLGLPVETNLAVAVLEGLVPSAGGGYWRMAFPEVQKWRSNRLERVVCASPWRWQPSSACEDRDGNLVVGTPGGGVYWISPEGRVHSVSKQDGLSHDSVSCVSVDREGTIWVGTLDGELNRLKRQSFAVLPGTETLTINSVTEDLQGTIWLGAARDGLAFSKTGALQFLPSYQFGSSVPAVFADQEGALWIGSEKENLLRRQNSPFQRMPGGALLPRAAQVIHQDRAGRMWFGTSEGLLLFDRREWKFFTTTNGLGSDHITALADDAAGNLWIGTRRGGLNRMHDGRFTTLRQADGAPSNDITGLWSDEAGVLWVATPSGLGRLQNGRWTRYTTREGFDTDQLGQIIDDGMGNLWIGSDKGVLRLSKAALTDFAEGKSSFISCRAFGKEDGLLTRACRSDSQPAAWRGRDGVLWFATQKGLASLDPAQFRPNTNPPLVTIDTVLVDDAPVRTRLTESEHSPTLVLHPGEERLEIQYASLNLGTPDRTRFRYQLGSYEKDWTESLTNIVRYHKLPRGDYLFRVIAANEDGIWNETGSSLAIVVEPPFWSTWWFIGATALTVFGLVAGIVHYLSTQKLQRQLGVLRQQEALEKERARIARDIHDQVGASLTQVALLGELVQTDKDSPGDVLEHAQQISLTARETTRALDEIVWTVNPQNDTLEGLVNYICKYAQDYLAVAGVSYRFDIPPQVPPRAVAPEVRHNVFLASKEAVTNIVRHARGTSAWIRIRIEPSSVILEIEDNGCGVADLDVNAPRTRNGLKNMRKRMEDIGGTFSLSPGTEGGALVRLAFPLT